MIHREMSFGRRRTEREEEPFYRAMERRNETNDDTLVLLWFDRKHAQLERLAALPFEERGVEHLIDDLLIRLACLVAFDELSLDELAIDLHRQAREDRALGQRK